MADLERPLHLNAAQLAQVRALCTALERDQGAPPLSDQALSLLSSDRVRHLLLPGSEGAASLAGYAQLDGQTAEVAAHDSDAAGELLDALTPAATSAWSHGRHSPVTPALEERRWRRTRELQRLRRSVVDRRSPHLPPDVHLRGFLVGQDEPALLGVNARAFAHHPEQGAWTEQDVRAREQEDWFEAAGVLLAERDGVLLGFHWTKMHPGRVGEVYVLAVDPQGQGLGLGRALLEAGLDHLAARGADSVILYVEGDNTVAGSLYRSAGFEVDDIDIQWSSSADLSSDDNGH